MHSDALSNDTKINDLVIFIMALMLKYTRGFYLDVYTILNRI